ncbi:POC1 centriolar protein [Steccherinum ochraceum]|uniref:POC1 centriolar protein n=1 Tax=Steccherinum ochraceum TaxID=92696 RepID=A0A4R0RCP7_9APHY|nr:POC1 centriolar protein [Steccherinum ochraceum]
MVTLKVIAATDLPPAKWHQGKTPSCYVKIVAGKDYELRTKSVSAETSSSPRWDESFDLALPLDSRIRIQLKWKYLRFGHAVLGEFTVVLSDIFQRQQKSNGLVVCDLLRPNGIAVVGHLQIATSDTLPGVSQTESGNAVSAATDSPGNWDNANALQTSSSSRSPIVEDRPRTSNTVLPAPGWAAHDAFNELLEDFGGKNFPDDPNPPHSGWSHSLDDVAWPQPSGWGLWGEAPVVARSGAAAGAPVAHDAAALQYSASQSTNGKLVQPPLPASSRAYPHSAAFNTMSLAEDAIQRSELDRSSNIMMVVPSNTLGMKVAADLLEFVCKYLQDVLDLGNILGEIHPIVGIAWRLVSSAAQAVKAQMSRDSDVVELVAVMAKSYKLIGPLKDERLRSPALLDAIKSTVNLTVECTAFILEYCEKGFAARLVRQTFSKTVQRKIEDFKGRFSDLQWSRMETTGGEVVLIGTAIRRSQVMQWLQSATTKATLPPCLPETRTELLGLVSKWVASPQGDQDKKVIWLHGLPGCGKSTVAATFVSLYRDTGWLGPCIFFDRKGEDIKPSDLILRLTKGLAEVDKDIEDRVLHTLEAYGHDVAERSLVEQFAILILEPLRALPEEYRATGEPLVIVLDGLNECGDARSRKELLFVLSQKTTQLPSWLRIIVTSREERDIVDAFESSPNIRSQGLDISTESNKLDIMLYIREAMRRIRESKTELPLENWPGDDAIQALSDKAAGLFIWAAIACAYDDGHDPVSRLETILRGSMRHQQLDELYLTILQMLGDWTDDSFATAFQDIVGAVVAAEEPLTDMIIDQVLDRPPTQPAIHTIKSLLCILTVQEDRVLQIIHDSFEDFITNSNAAAPIGAHWLITLPQQRQDLALGCLSLLAADVSQPAPEGMVWTRSHLKQKMGPGLLHAYRHWVPYLCSPTSAFDVPPEELEIMLRPNYFFRWWSVVQAVWSSSVALALAGDLLTWSRTHISSLASFHITNADLKQLEDDLDGRRLTIRPSNDLLAVLYSKREPESRADLDAPGLPHDFFESLEEALDQYTKWSSAVEEERAEAATPKDDSHRETVMQSMSTCLTDTRNAGDEIEMTLLRFLSSRSTKECTLSSTDGLSSRVIEIQGLLQLAAEQTERFEASLHLCRLEAALDKLYSSGYGHIDTLLNKLSDMWRHLTKLFTQLNESVIGMITLHELYSTSHTTSLDTTRAQIRSCLQYLTNAMAALNTANIMRIMAASGIEQSNFYRQTIQEACKYSRARSVILQFGEASESSTDEFSPNGSNIVLEALQAALDAGVGDVFRPLLQGANDLHGLPWSYYVQDVGDVKVRNRWQKLQRGRYKDADVVIKVIPFTGDRQHLANIVRWRQFRHRNLQPFVGINLEVFAPNPAVISPWVQPGNVRAVIRSKELSDLSPLRRQWIKDVASGLAYLHAWDVLHGDLHGANVLIDEYSALLADFGFTTNQVSDSTSSMLSPSPPVPWAAPELLSESPVVADAACDVFSFGRTCVEIYTGEDPFGDATSIDVANYITNNDHPPRPTSALTVGNVYIKSEEMSDSLWELVLQCWKTEPDSRPDMVTVVQTIEHLEDVAVGL